MARPTKLTKKVRQTLLNAIGLGLPISRACALAGVSVASFNEWIRRGNGLDHLPADRRFTTFSADVDRAHATFQARKLRQIEDHCAGKVIFAKEPDPDHPGHERVLLHPRTGQPVVEQEIRASWAAAAWMLERRFPEEYGQVLDRRSPEVEQPLQNLPAARLVSRLELLTERLRQKSLPAAPGPIIDAETVPQQDQQEKQAQDFKALPPKANGNGNGNGHQ